MTARVTLCCDGTFDDGRMPCRGGWSIDAERLEPGCDLVDVEEARHLAAAAGWSSTLTSGVPRDYCPAHTRQRAAR